MHIDANGPTFRNTPIKNEVLIETGTGLGHSVNAALKMRFRNVFSCQIYPDNHLIAVARFVKRPRVHLYLDEPVSFLKKVINPKKTTTFFLRARHIPNKPESLLLKECPLLEELAVIFSFSWDNSPLIIIDDATMYENGRNVRKIASFYDINQWPNEDQIRNILPPEWLLEKDGPFFYCYHPKWLKKSI